MIGLPDADNLALDDETWERACLAAEERWVDDKHPVSYTHLTLPTNLCV